MPREWFCGTAQKKDDSYTLFIKGPGEVIITIHNFNVKQTKRIIIPGSDSLKYLYEDKKGKHELSIHIHDKDDPEFRSDTLRACSCSWKISPEDTEAISSVLIGDIEPETIRFI